MIRDAGITDRTSAKGFDTGWQGNTVEDSAKEVSWTGRFNGVPKALHQRHKLTGIRKMIAVDSNVEITQDNGRVVQQRDGR